MQHENKHGSDQVRRIWPEGESACIWMQAGLIAFKLCDRAFECETCPFDGIMRGGAALAPSLTRHFFRMENPGVSPEQLGESSTLRHRPLTFNSNVWYGAGFWYVQPTSETALQIGLSEVGLTFLPQLKEVILPRPGTSVTNTQTSMWLIASEGTIGLSAPCAGTVKQCNSQLLEMLLQHPSAAEDHTWFLELEVPSCDSALKGLVKGAKAAEYMRAQHYEILTTLEEALEPQRKELGATSADGGVRLSTPEEMLGSKRYFHLLAQFYRR